MAIDIATSAPRPRERRPLHRQLVVQVLVAIILGALLGHFLPEAGRSLKVLGDLFIKLVRMIIAPVIFLTVAGSLSKTRDFGGTGRIVAKALAYFFVVSTLALLIGLVVGNLVQPGAGMNVAPATLDAHAVSSYVEKGHDTTLTGFLLAIVPDTLVSSLTSGSILQALFAGALFGAATSLGGTSAESVRRALAGATTVIFRIVDFVMVLAPIGTFGAIAFTVGQYGAGSLLKLGELIATFYLTALLFVVIVLGLISRVHGFSLLRLLVRLRAELLLVFGTSSSEAALPALIERLEEAGCDPTVVGLVVPTGYSFNLDGTNIYMTLASLFIAQAIGMHLTLEQQILLVGVAMLSSKGAAGVTGAGFITLAATLQMIPGLPVAGMALILGADRFMSQCRSLTNFIGNAVASLVIARWEGKLDLRRFAGP